MTISSKYQITLPSKVREKLKLKAGDKVVFIEADRGFELKKLDDLADEMAETMKDFEKTEKEFQKGFRFREVDVNGDMS